MKAVWIFLALLLLPVSLAPQSMLARASGQGQGREPLRKTIESTEISDALLKLSSLKDSEVVLNKLQSVYGVRLFKDLEKFIQWGDASYTEVSIIREMDVKTGQEKRNLQLQIYLSENLRWDSTRLITTLMHELIHAAFGQNQDPYDPTLKVKDYVESGVIGPGGEVQATLWECRTAAQILPESEYWARFPLCKEVHLKTQEESVEYLGRQFFSLGQYATQFERELEPFKLAMTDFGLASREKNRILSGTTHLPYPMEFLRKYRNLTVQVCENTRERLKSQRVPASQMAPIWVAQAQSLEKNRCRSN